MLKTHVIILAQGSQSRLPLLDIPKQCLPLAACGGMPIILRTVLQLMHVNPDGGAMKITLVCHGKMASELSAAGALGDRGDSRRNRECCFGTLTLSDPGNSSLKGIARSLAQLRGVPLVAFEGEPEVTVVLLGDVIYSWRCLHEIFDASRDISFVTSSDLGPSSGEVWGLAWKHATGWPLMSEALDKALVKHPPFHDTYQPGQMRNWLWALRPRDQKVAQVIVDDYTKDIDRPDHLPLVAGISRLAAADDAAHGLTW